MINYIVEIFWNAAIELFLFVVVDTITKLKLKQTGLLIQKKWLWQVEGLALLTVSLLLCAFHHTPFLLMTLGICPLVYSVAVGYISPDVLLGMLVELINILPSFIRLLRRGLNHVVSKLRDLKQSWDVFTEHNDSIQKSEEQQRQMYVDGTAPFFGQNGQRPPSALPRPQPFMQDSSNEQVAYHPGFVFQKRPVRMHLNYDKTESSMPPNVTPFDALQPASSVIAQAAASDEADDEDARLANARVPQKQGYQTSKISSIFKKVSKLLYTKGSLPSGLTNTGNLCFMNSVLQCFASIPNFVENLRSEVVENRVHNTQLSSACYKLLDVLDLLNSNSEEVVSTSQLVLAFSEVNPSMFSDTQVQQDSAEFLIWLISKLHEALNTAHSRRQVLQSPPCEDEVLGALKKIYGDFSPKRSSSMKQLCQRELDSISDFDTLTKAEAMQRLADLDWIEHKSQNCSSVDSTFFGQLLEVQQFSRSKRITVGLQAFSVLPIHLAKSGPPTSAVSLYDCLAHFGRVETLLLPDITSLPQPDKSNPTSVNGGVTHGSPVLSPIAGPPRRTALPNVAYNTSTPVVGELRPVVAPPSVRPVPVTDVQKCAYLRQLPPCLVLQVLRFQVVPPGITKKVYTRLSVPLVDLDLGRYTYDHAADREDMTAVTRSHKYDLSGIVLHLGSDSVNSGHCIAYCRQQGMWYRFDDDTVSSVNMEHELKKPEIQQNIYLMFYARNDGKSN